MFLFFTCCFILVICCCVFFFFKQKTAYEMRISDWSSDVCSSDLLFGARLVPLPGLAVRTDGRAISGFLVPDLRISRSNGVETSGHYYLRVADHQDLTLGTHVFTKAAPMVSAEWRHLTGAGAYQITGFATHSRPIPGTTGEQHGRTAS